MCVCRPAVVVLLMSMVNEKQPFSLRCSVLYCFQCFLFKNEIGQSQLVQTLLPSSTEGMTRNGSGNCRKTAPKQCLFAESLSQNFCCLLIKYQNCSIDETAKYICDKARMLEGYWNNFRVLNCGKYRYLMFSKYVPVNSSSVRFIQQRSISKL